MRMTYISDEQEVHNFVLEAAAHFADHPDSTTYTAAEIVPGCFFAVRWGWGKDCVLVFQLGDMVPTVYQSCIVNRPAQVPEPVRISELSELIIHPKPFSQTFDDDIPF